MSLYNKWGPGMKDEVEAFEGKANVSLSSADERVYLNAIVTELTTFRTDISRRLDDAKREISDVRTSLACEVTSLNEAVRRVSNIEEELAHAIGGISTVTRTLRPSAKLSQIAIVLYGGVLSYACYVLAENLIIAGVVESVRRWWDAKIFLDTLMRFFLFIPVSLFLVKDLGDVVMIESRFPARRELRYVYELTAALFYLTTFALVTRGSFLSLMSFAGVLASGGLWCSELRREYPIHPYKIAELAKTLRTLHYLGSALFMLLVGVLWSVRPWFPYDREPSLRASVAAIVVVCFAVWYVQYERLPRKLHGRCVRRYLLSYVRIARRLRRHKWFGDGRVH